jgi:phosphate starvation-inducible PhoH-like protein
MRKPLALPPEAAEKQTSRNYTELSLTPVDNQRLANLSGQFDEHLHFLEKESAVEIHHRGHDFHLYGEAQKVEVVMQVLLDLYIMSEEKVLTLEDFHLSLQEKRNDLLGQVDDDNDEFEEVVINTRFGKVRGRGYNQQQYLYQIAHHDINFGIGPAGTGKTYLAVACAVDALERDEVRRIILARPAVEAGERLGFLPGDLSQKVDPYLRPLYDALYEMMGVEKVMRLIERNVIEIAPLAYMRGRTLNDSFIILDEAQNTTIEQMKMFLTRIGFGSTAVVTGDVTQIDLPREQLSGLKQIMKILRGVSGISFSYFGSRDVVRHPLVQKVIDAYEAYDRKEKDDD